MQFRRNYITCEKCKRHGTFRDGEGGEIHSHQVRLYQIVLRKVLSDRACLLALFQSGENALVDVAAKTDSSMSRCRHENGTRSHKAVPNKRAWLRLDLIRHQECQLGAGRCGSYIVPLLEIVSIVRFALAFCNECSQIQVLDLVDLFSVVKNACECVVWVSHSDRSLKWQVGLELQTEVLLLVREKVSIERHNVKLPGTGRLVTTPFPIVLCNTAV